MINRYTIKKSWTILALALWIALFLPEASFAQGTIVGYGYGKKWIEELSEYPLTGFPTIDQLDRLTHVIASDIGCNEDGSLFTGKLPAFWQGTPPSDNIWNGSKNEWLVSLINRAQAKGVKVSICVGGDTLFFPQATNPANLTTFVSNIVDFVNEHGFDGVDIDWERPRNLTEWNQCIALLQALRAALPSKRITIALPGGTWFYPDTINNSEQKNILDAVHAIHLMTYDESEWPNHSSTAHSKNAINNWITWQTPTCAQKKKLFLGSAFYGYKKSSNGNTLWGERNKVSYVTYSGGGNYNRGDLPDDARSKVIHTRDNGFGGVFIWELGYDLPANDSQSLLKAMHEAIPISISGPTLVCNTSRTFQLNNLTAGTSVSWSYSGNLVPPSVIKKCTTPCIHLRAENVSNGGPGWVQATISGPCGDVVLPKHDVWVGVPKEPSDIFGFTYDGMQFNSNSEYGFWAITHYSQQINYYEWFVTGGTIQYGQGTQHLHVKTGNASFSNNFSVELRTDNNCGISPTLYRYGYLIPGGGDPFESDTTQLNDKLKLAISPNPASSNITVSEVLRSNDNTHWQLRLMNQQGTILVETTSTLPNSISLQGLLPGAYVLHAIQGQYVEQQVVLVK